MNRLAALRELLGLPVAERGSEPQQLLLYRIHVQNDCKARREHEGGAVVGGCGLRRVAGGVGKERRVAKRVKWSAEAARHRLARGGKVAVRGAIAQSGPAVHDGGGADGGERRGAAVRGARPVDAL